MNGVFMGPPDAGGTYAPLKPPNSPAPYKAQHLIGALTPYQSRTSKDGASTTAGPKAAASRPKSVGNGQYVTAVVLFLVIEYAAYTFVGLVPLLLDPSSRTLGLVLTSLFNLIVILVVTSYYKCVATDPGSIPRHWAFYRGDVAKRRRYCKECNVWKPDRTHHCSTCARCVLNMDHHCPWINNCVGFYNRKYFMQLLFYGVIALGLIFTHGIIHISYTLYSHVIDEKDAALTNQPPPQTLVGVFEFIVSILLTGVSGFLFTAVVQFTIFHIKLVSNNMTTIESLTMGVPEGGKYDLGVMRNCQQVLGPRLCLWWLPLDVPQSAPTGDGVRWTQSAESQNI